MISILILGSKGMVGRYVYKYLSKALPTQNYSVSEMNRDKLDIFALHNSGQLHHRILSVLEDGRYTFVINCMGITNKRDVGVFDYFVVNSYFPILLSKCCSMCDCVMIHTSTDCIYSGSIGDYTPDSFPECNTVYGLSKYFGDFAISDRCFVIRSSIIGEVGVGSLVDWVKMNKGKTIEGFTNQMWNGVTCLEFAKRIERIIDNSGKESNKLIILSSTFQGKKKMSKYELVKAISDTFELDCIVIPVLSGDVVVDKSLCGGESDKTKDITIQLNELKDFSKVLYQ